MTRRISNLEPAGTIKKFGGSSAPSGYQFCQGQAISRTTFAALFAAIGTTYGVGDGSTTFNIPDFRGRSPIGSGTGAGLSPRALGAFAGEENHALTTGELASHSHSITDPGHAHTTQSYVSAAGAPLTTFAFGGNALLASSGTNAAGTGITTTQNNGSGTAHNNMHPYLVVNYIIKL